MDTVAQGAKMKFTQWIRESIQDSKYTRQEIADHTGVSKPAVDKWMAGDQHPKTVPLFMLCSLLWPLHRAEHLELAALLLMREKR